MKIMLEGEAIANYIGLILTESNLTSNLHHESILVAINYKYKQLKPAWYHFMNDSNNNDKKNSHEANLAKIANVKPRKKKRNSNIYEKFLNRVQTDISKENSNTNNLKPLKNKKNKSEYQSIEADELQSFTFKDLELVIEEDDDKDLANPSTTTTKGADNSILNDGSDGDVEPFQPKPVADDVLNVEVIAATADIVESIAEDSTDLSLKESERLKVSTNKSRKPLIIGLIIGSLLSVIIVVALTTTGILSTSDKNQVSDENATEPTSTATPPVTAEPKVNEQPNTVETNIESQTNSNTDSQPAPSNQPADSQSATPQKTDGNANSAITLDDFKEESETTFYRETSD